VTKRVSKEEKINTILEGLDSGKSREDLAVVLGYKDWRGIDVLMRREGYVYKDDRYVLPAGKEAYQPKAFMPEPVRIVLQELKMDKKDFTAIAAKAGFTDRNDLATYMKAQGWLWSSAEGTYIKDSSNSEKPDVEPMDEQVPEAEVPTVEAEVDFERFLPLLEYLEARKDHLEHLLQTTDSKQIPHYNFHGGNTITKSVSMSSNLDQLIRDFSSEMGVSQRVIFEAALVQFMERYGYGRQVKTLLHR